MKRKITAVLTALCCMATCFAGMTVSAEETTPSVNEFAVIGVDDTENPQNYIIKDISDTRYTTPCSLDASMIAQHLVDTGETIAYGDILRLTGTFCSTTLDGTNDCFFMNSDATIEIIGSIYDKASMKTFDASSNLQSRVTLTDAEGSAYTYIYNFLDYSDYTQPGGIDWTAVAEGDAVEMYTYNGVPMIPYTPHPWYSEYFLILDAEQRLVVQLPDSELAENYAAAHGAEAYKIASYGVEIGTIGCGSSAADWPAEDKVLTDGDVLSISGVTGVAEIFPCCIHFDENSTIANNGQPEDFAEKKTLTMTMNSGTMYVMEDAEGKVYYYSDFGAVYAEISIMDQFSEGDAIDFWVSKNTAIAPIGAAETPDTNARRGIVTNVPSDNSLNKWYVNLDGHGTVTMSMAYLAEGSELPEYGDVIEITGEYSIAETYPAQFYGMDDCVITNLGSAAELYSTQTLTLTEKTAKYEEYYEYVLTDAEGTEYTYWQDMVFNPMYYDMSQWAVGDEAVFVMNEKGNPEIPVEVTRMGDANLDSTVNIMDVILLNRNILGAQELPAYESKTRAAALHPADFNRDGTADAADALDIMRRIVGLV